MEITPELITQYGLMSKISTGNSFIDMAFCLLVPLLLKHLIPFLSGLPQRLWPAKQVKSYTRVIEFTQRSGHYWYDSDDQPSNSILQRAVLNLINRHMASLKALPEVDLTLRRRPAREAPLDDDAAVCKPARGGDGEDDGTDYDDGYGGSYDDHAYCVNLVPPLNVAVELENGVSFMRVERDLDDKQKNTLITYMLESKKSDGNERIEQLLNSALETYRKEQSATVDPARYLYMPVLSGFHAPPSGDDNSSTPSAVYKRYKLSEEKTFASFFHPDKEPLLRLVDQFLSKTGKFSIPGYPQKLGFLLYGPPGTGKTSLIKALAQYTKRSIISIPLSKLSTNQELMDIVFDNKLTLQNSSDSNISLPYSKTIFVMEDVDAASSVVQRRTPDQAAGPSQAEMAVMAEQLAAARMAAAAAAHGSGSRTPSGKGGNDAASLSNDGKGEDDQDEDTDSDEEDSRKGRSRRSSGARAAGPASASCVSSGAGASTSYWQAGTVGPSPGPAMAAFGKKLFKGEDELNLAGLLNVLDGVVDTPNRIIIMTTNHPEKLDPALIRPGRINKKIYMGRLRISEALCMLRHYFGPVSPADEAALRRVLEDDKLSPADLEAMCAEYDTPAELIEAVAERMASGAESFKSCL